MPYGPRTGQSLALGDTRLRLRITDRMDDAHEELHIGFAKTARDGIGLAPVTTAQSCDVVLTNVIVMDPEDGVRVASIGIRHGIISGIGKAGNPNTSSDVDVVVGSGTVIVDADGLIATPGGIDSHVHALSPKALEAQVASGMTTVITQEAGPAWGVGLGSPRYLSIAAKAMESIPINVGFLGRASSASQDPLREMIDAHVCGFKVHEDTGATLRTIDQALTCADEFDVQVALHTDGLNETLSVADTLAVIDGRAIHAFHVEGCGGGHAPDVLTLAGRDNVIASSTNPTLPYGTNALAEHLDMIMAVHGLDPSRPTDVAIASARLRGATMAAENHLHDRGVIPITSSDAQGMGRAGETWWRTFALASVLRPEENEDDNDRILRYLAKVTINPARAHGLGHALGRLAPGYVADIVLWDHRAFAAKPTLVLKAGFPVWGASGDANASVLASEPMQLREQFGALGAAPAELSYLLTSEHAAASSPPPAFHRLLPVHGCRDVRASDMVRHGVTGTVEVEPNGAGVRFDGEELTMTPTRRVPLSRTWFW